MVEKRSIKLLFIFFLVFSLFTSSFLEPVQAIDQVESETIEVIGNEKLGLGDLLSETIFEIEGNTTALEVLQKTVGTSNVEVLESTYGKMITGINSLKAKDTFYWALYINGISSQVGADQYIVQKGDKISFRYVDWTVAPEKTVSIKVAGNEEKPLISDVSNIAFLDEPTAFQLLKMVLGDKVKYSETQYGKMITSIDGIESKGTFYWAFYVNGQLAPVGADSYKLKAGDQISFQYESWEKPAEEPKNENTPLLEEISTIELQKSIDLASKYVLKNHVGEWEAVALMQAGKKIPEDYLSNVTKIIKDKKGKFSKITDYERYTLGIVAAGGNPTNVGGYNLVESIYNGEITKQGLNGVFYALISLDSAKFEIPKTAKWSRETLVSYLLEKQNQDGGWSWDGSKKSDIDTTAMVLTSLAPYKNQSNVKASIEVGVNYLSSQYLTGKIDNSSTASQVVIALSSINLEAYGKLFYTEDSSLLSYLFSFQNIDGGFDWQGGDVSDVFSTSQAIQAIVSLQLSLTGKGPLYNLPLHPVAEKPEDSKKPNQPSPDDQVDTGNSSTKEDEKNIDQPTREGQSENANPEYNNEQGKPLPQTATNQYNFLVLGISLLLISAFFFIIEKRKKA